MFDREREEERVKGRRAVKNERRERRGTGRSDTARNSYLSERRKNVHKKPQRREGEGKKWQ